MTLVIGLTGGIGTGKSTIARQFAYLGAEIFDADAFVHQILEKDKEIISEIKKHFSEVFLQEKIDRVVLGKIVFANKNKLEILENIIHPAVRKAEEAFIVQNIRKRTRFIVLEIPLLFESRADNICDITICTDCPDFLQAQRVLKRKNMTPEKLKSILKRQMTKQARKNMADIIIQTGLGKAFSLQKIKGAIKTP
jgi:dephospho-CoA kinase